MKTIAEAIHFVHLRGILHLEPIDIEPLVTGVTEQGTEMYPFPPPTLTLRRVAGREVELGWRATPSEFVLESTENLAAPKWTRLPGSRRPSTSKPPGAG